MPPVTDFVISKVSDKCEGRRERQEGFVPPVTDFVISKVSDKCEGRRERQEGFVPPVTDFVISKVSREGGEGGRWPLPLCTRD